MTDQSDREQTLNQDIDDIRRETQWLIYDALDRQDLRMAAKAVREIRVVDFRLMEIPQDDTCTHSEGIDRLVEKIEYIGWMLEVSSKGDGFLVDLRFEQDVLRGALVTMLGPDSHKASAMRMVMKMVSAKRAEKSR